MSPYQLMAGRAVALARPLPLPLIAARARVFDPLACLDLNQTARRVLFGILTFVRVKKLSGEIFPRRDTLRAEALLNSISPLYRGLKVLEEKGYITRGQLRKRLDGKFYLSPIFLTGKAVALLGLDQVIHKQPSAATTHGHIKKELTNEQQSIQKTTGDQNSARMNQIDRKTRLPVDLVPLVDQGVKRAAVCWLMARAKKAGKRLGDVLQVVRSNIAGLRGREIVGYLASMLAKDVDFAWVARQSREQACSSALEATVREKLKTLDHRFDGYQVVAEDGTVVGVFRSASSPGQLALVHSAAGTMPVNLRFAKAWVDGKFRLVPCPSPDPADADADR
jgi:hypothetical protein